MHDLGTKVFGSGCKFSVSLVNFWYILLSFTEDVCMVWGQKYSARGVNFRSVWLNFDIFCSHLLKAYAWFGGKSIRRISMQASGKQS